MHCIDAHVNQRLLTVSCKRAQSNFANGLSCPQTATSCKSNLFQVKPSDIHGGRQTICAYDCFILVQVYTDVKQLRYGHLMIMTDQDHDGSHIKGLIMNYFHTFYPSLMKLPGFLIEFITPVIKVNMLLATYSHANIALQHC